MIIITAKKDGFRRCGMAHSAKPVQHGDDAFSAAQLEQLQAEPMLVVELIDVPKNPGPDDLLKQMVVAEPVALETPVSAVEDHLANAAEANQAPKKGGKKSDKE